MTSRAFATLRQRSDLWVTCEHKRIPLLVLIESTIAHDGVVPCSSSSSTLAQTWCAEIWPANPTTGSRSADLCQKMWAYRLFCGRSSGVRRMTCAPAPVFWVFLRDCFAIRTKTFLRFRSRAFISEFLNCFLETCVHFLFGCLVYIFSENHLQESTMI